MNKKGMAAETLGKFILVFLVVFILLFGFNRLMKGGTKIVECTASGGKCTPGTCDFGTEVPMLADKAAGCKSGEICCVKINREAPKPDPLCNGLKFTDSCDTKNNLYFCDKVLQCVTRCEFCAKNFDTSEVKNMLEKSPCKPTFNYEGFSCKCDKATCDTKSKSNPPGCTLDTVNYPSCPGKNYGDQDYACCK